MQTTYEKLQEANHTIGVLWARIEALKGELQASEDGKEQLEAQLEASKECYSCGYTS